MKRVGEIALFTPDVDRLVQFYARVLGAEPAHWQRGAMATFIIGEVKLVELHGPDRR